MWMICTRNKPALFDARSCCGKLRSCSGNVRSFRGLSRLIQEIDHIAQSVPLSRGASAPLQSSLACARLSKNCERKNKNCVKQPLEQNKALVGRSRNKWVMHCWRRKMALLPFISIKNIRRFQTLERAKLVGHNVSVLTQSARSGSSDTIFVYLRQPSHNTLQAAWEPCIISQSAKPPSKTAIRQQHAGTIESTSSWPPGVFATRGAMLAQQNVPT